MEEIDSKKSLLKNLKNNIKKVEKNLKLNDVSKKARLGNTVCTIYDPTIRFMYEGVDDADNYPAGPFSRAIRMLLVDSILNNITFLNDQEISKLRVENKLKNIVNKNRNLTGLLAEEPVTSSTKNQDKLLNSCKGLPYMIAESYFVDSFVLHDESERQTA